MKVLALESSCDETAAAVVEGGTRILSNVISSQARIHEKYGGVVPELASRHHVINVLPVLEEALAEAGLSLEEVDGIAVTRGPGLVGALLVAVQVGKSLAYARGLPLVGVHHLEGHLSAIYLHDEPPPAFPHLGLLVSGGHTALVLVRGHGSYEELGSTRDDAAGEAFDKVGKLLGLGYPAGPVIDRLAKGGDPGALELPRPMHRKGELAMSFSGLKTWMVNWVRVHGLPEGQALADVCASFQHAVVRSLVSKTRDAVKLTGAREVQIAGGVAANSYLKAELRRAGEEDGFRVCVPPPRLCTDNAAMIAAAGYHRLVAGQRDGWELNAEASLPLPRGVAPAGGG